MTWLRKVKGWGRDQRGVGLVESLVAVAILGITVVAFVMALSSGAVAVREGNQQLVAQSLVRTQLEYIKPQDYIPTADYDPDNPDASYDTVYTPEGYDILVEVDSIPDTDTDTDIQRITVTISRGGEDILTIEDYKVNR
ncbi:hypothetical protein ES703_68590 [subsurface metagenome]